MKLALYQIINRELVFAEFVNVPDECTFWDGWLHANGYGPEFTLRRGMVQDITAADVAALGPISAPLMSIGDMIVDAIRNDH